MMKQFQPSDKSIMTLFLTISLLMTGCDTPKSSLPSFAGKPRIKINPHQELFQTPKRSLNPFVDLDLDLDVATPDSTPKEGQ